MVFLELFRQCSILELFGQGSILELFRQCSILELFRQCGILELFLQCSIFGFIVIFCCWYCNQAQVITNNKNDAYFNRIFEIQ